MPREPRTSEEKLWMSVGETPNRANDCHARLSTSAPPASIKPLMIAGLKGAADIGAAAESLDNECDCAGLIPTVEAAHEMPCSLDSGVGKALAENDVFVRADQSAIDIGVEGYVAIWSLSMITTQQDLTKVGDKSDRRQWLTGRCDFERQDNANSTDGAVGPAVRCRSRACRTYKRAASGSRNSTASISAL